MSKKIFSDTTPITPDVLNAWQNLQWVSLDDYPVGTSNLDLNNGIYFTPPVNVSKDITGFPGDSKIYLDGAGNLSDPWGGRVFTATQEQLTTANYVTPPGYITLWVTSGSIIKISGEVVSWNSQFINILNNVTSYIYVTDGALLVVSPSLPNRSIARVQLAKIVFTNTSVYTIQDIRPCNKVGAKDDLPLSLINTGIKVANYQMLVNDLVLCDSTGGEFVITLPPNASDNDRVGLTDVAGSFGAFPVILIAPQVEQSPGVFIPMYSISGVADSWQFSVPRTYVSLVYSASRNDWIFEETPNDACAGQLGSFLRCGGAIPGITVQINCLPPNTWDSQKLLCMRPSTAAVYSDGSETQANQYVEYNSIRCGAGTINPIYKTPISVFKLELNLPAETLTNLPLLPVPYTIVSYKIYEGNVDITSQIYVELHGNQLKLESIDTLQLLVVALGS